MSNTNAKKNTGHDVKVTHAPLVNPLPDLAKECLRNVGQEPSYCHEWKAHKKIGGIHLYGVFAYWCTMRGSSEQHNFSKVLQAANNALFNAGVHPLHGISKEKAKSIFDKLPRALDQLRAYAIVNGETMTVEEFKAQLREYIKCVNGRAPTIQKKIKELGADKDWNGLALSKKNEGMWGCRRQYACAKTVSRLLAEYHITDIELHPVLAVMLNPAGGIAGWGNWVMWMGDLHDSVNVHAVVHDAFGYIYTFHDKKGRGYNYLETRTLFSTSSPLCCQLQGIWQARKSLKKMCSHGNEGRLKRARFVVKDRNLTTIPGPDKKTVEAAEAYVLRSK